MECDVSYDFNNFRKLMVSKQGLEKLPGSFGRISSIALEGKIRAERMHVSGVDCMIRRSLSRPNRKFPGKPCRSDSLQHETRRIPEKPCRDGVCSKIFQTVFSLFEEVM